MPSFRRLFRLIGREPAPAEDIADEFETHLSLRTEALIREGMPPADARREAERRFGSKAQFAVECRAIDHAERRERRRREWWAGLGQDLRQAARALRRAPGFALAAVAVLGTGVGLNATVFTVLRGVVLRPLDYPHPDRLVAVHSSNPKGGWPEFAVSPTDFFDWQREVRAFSSMVAWSSYTAAATGQGPAEQVDVTSVTAGFTPVTEVAPVLGRGFTAGEFEPGSPRVAILSHGLWLRRFGGDRGVLGRGWILDGERYEIIGVMPAGFEFPVGEASVWTPFRTPADLATQRGAHYVDVAARLADGATLEGARAELVTLADRIARTFPKSSANWTVMLRSLHEEVVGDIRPTLLLLMTGVGLLLLLACANVANLVLVRTIGRSGETALRSALGAGRGRLLWHGSTEVGLLVAAGLALAVPIAIVGVDFIRTHAPEGVPRLEGVRLDPASLLFTLGAAALVALLVSLAPAVRIARLDLRAAMAGLGGRNLGGRRGLHRWLVSVETMVALALLAVAGVLLKSRDRLERVDPGFDPGNTLVADISLPDTRYGKGDAIVAFQREILRRLRELPGAQSAALIFRLPLAGYGFSSSFRIDSIVLPDDANQSAQLRVVSADYFATQRIPLVAGRGFTDLDRRGGRLVALVNQAAVRRFWPDGKAIGHFVRVDAQPGPDDDRPQGEIVGVVGDIRDRALDREPRPIIYVVNEQTAVGEVTLVVRSKGAPLTLSEGVRRVITAMDPELPVSGVRTMADVVAAVSASARFRAWLMGCFALLAVILAGLGVYGVISHLVAQQTREIGLRRALGASDARVVGEVVRRGMADAALGAGAGVLVGWLIARRLGAALFQVRPGDPLVLGTATALFLGVAFVACWIPARRATGADPVGVLRGE